MKLTGLGVKLYLHVCRMTCKRAIKIHLHSQPLEFRRERTLANNVAFWTRPARERAEEMAPKASREVNNDGLSSTPSTAVFKNT
jgi:hypothetical protein